MLYKDKGKYVGWKKGRRKFTESEFKNSWIKKNMPSLTYPIYKKTKLPSLHKKKKSSPRRIGTNQFGISTRCEI